MCIFIRRIYSEKDSCHSSLIFILFDFKFFDIGKLKNDNLIIIYDYANTCINMCIFQKILKLHLSFKQIKLNFIQIGISVLKIKRAYMCIPRYHIYFQHFITALKSHRSGFPWFSDIMFRVFILLEFELLLFTSWSGRSLRYRYYFRCNAV